MIIIVGAGLGGLTLARYLNAHMVEFRIFEQSDEQREQGFGLTLQPPVTELLPPLLQLSFKDFKNAVAVDRKDGTIIPQLMDFVTGEVAQANTYPSDAIRSNRKRLRLIIQGSLNIEFNHKLISIREANGTVVAGFANGVEVSGNLLIAADGIHSFIRRTLLPHVGPRQSEFEGVMYNGIRTMSIQDFEEKLRPTLGPTCLRIGFDSEGCRIILVTIFDWDQEKNVVSISWAYSRRIKGPNDPLYTPYTPGHTIRTTPSQLWEEIRNLQHPLSEPFRTIFSDPDISKDKVIRHLLVTFAIPQKDLSSTLRKHRTVFIADSAHVWSNHAGTGGNNAILDALSLGRTLVEGKDPDTYYDERSLQWEHAIAKNIETYNNLHKTKDEWHEFIEAQRQSTYDL